MNLESVDGVEVRAYLAQPGEQRRESQVPPAGCTASLSGEELSWPLRGSRQRFSSLSTRYSGSNPHYPSEILAPKPGSLCALEEGSAPLLMGRAAHRPEEASL